MFYVSVQDLDYDDYPVGVETKIGPFVSKYDAGQFLETSYQFQLGEWGTWRNTRRLRHHSVSIKPVDMGFRDPSEYM